ncbi:DMT family transporter [Psychrobacter sp. T6-1]|uniref:DMT family transporter n=1 Tax=Psychrobacter sp. T6-1 TaxID=3457447 RepID=UPI003FD07754
MNKMIFGVVFSLLWSSAFIAGKYSVDYMSPLSFLSVRFLLAGMLLLGLYQVLKRRHKLKISTNKTELLSRSMCRDAIILALLNYVLYLGLSYSGLQYVSPELVVLLVSTTPFLTAFAQSYLSKKWSAYLWIALTLGFLGVVVVLVARVGGVESLLSQLQNPAQTDEFLWGVGCVLLSVVALAAGTLYYQLIASSHNVVALTGLQNLSAGVMLLPFVSVFAWGQALSVPIFVYSLLYQVILISGAAMLMWFQLIRWFGSGYASAFHLLNPIFVTLLSVWLFDIDLSVSDVIGTIMVVIAMGIISLDVVSIKAKENPVSL